MNPGAGVSTTKPAFVAVREWGSTKRASIFVKVYVYVREGVSEGGMA